MQKLIAILTTLLLTTTASAVTLQWDASTNWTSETKVVLIITEPDGTEYRLLSVPALGLTQEVEDAYFDYGQTYKIHAIAFDGENESVPSNTVEYIHRDGPTVLELPVMVPAERPDTLILQFNFGG